jgi:type I restriction enzyme S subunit
MSFPRYERYKDSGVEWLGKVPEHWQVRRLRYSARLVTEKATQQTNPLALENIESWTGRLLPSETKFEGDGTSFRIGDLLFGKLRPYLAKAYLAESEGEAVGDFHVMRPSPFISGRFLFHQLINRDSIALLDGSTFGSKMPRVGWDFMANMVLATPPIAEQARIADFIAQETAKIDALIEEQRRLIELLKEKRQAVISHAVTKGLDLDVPMRDCGVDWIGLIPQPWGISKLGQMANIVRGGSPRPAGDPRFFNGDFMPWITVGEVTKDDSMYLVTTESMLTEVGAEQSRTIDIGTLVLTNSGATLGVPKILGITGCANDGILAFLALNDNVNKKYLYFVLGSLTSELRERMKQGSGQPNLNTGIVGALNVPLPPVAEQLAIVVELERMQDEFAALMAQAETSVTLLQERRSALISAAVTGKIDVRNYTPKGAA